MTPLENINMGDRERGVRGEGVKRGERGEGERVWREGDSG